MEFKNILFQAEGSVLTVTLHRPKVFNALNGDMLRELAAAIELCKNDESIRVLILTGSGGSAFSSGADLKEGVVNARRPLGDVLKENYEPVILGLRNLPKPVICKMNGIAAGAGMSLALACDMIIADENAYMTELFVGIGLMPDGGSMYFLPRIVGVQRAFELFSTGRKICMKEAFNLGIVNKIVPTEELNDAVNQMASYYAQAPTFAIGQMKKVLNMSMNSSLEAVMKLEADGQTACGFSPDFAEGVMAFMQKRKPEFKGQKPQELSL